MASLLLSTGKYLHTAYAVSNIAEEFTNDDWSLSSQEGFGYIGQYIDDSAVDSSDPTDYVWTEFLDEDVDDLDDEGDMPMADFQSQIDALQDQIEVLQGDAENLQSSIEVNASNVADSAQLASEAADIANATGQYFWHDSNGAHVSTEENNPEGERNSIWNSLGMLFRKGATNLLAILAGGAAGTDPKGIAVYDGQGNDDENIVASFTDEGIAIGKEGGMQTLINASDILLEKTAEYNYLPSVFYTAGFEITDTAMQYFYNGKNMFNLKIYGTDGYNSYSGYGVTIVSGTQLSVTLNSRKPSRIRNFYMKNADSQYSDSVSNPTFTAVKSGNNYVITIDAGADLVNFASADPTTIIYTINISSDDGAYSQLLMGKYPAFASSYYLAIGGGTEDTPTNIFTVSSSGDVTASGNITGANLTGSQTADYTGSYTMGNCTILTGSVTINVTTANTNTDKAVTFGPTFKHTPCVQCTMLNIGGSYYQRVTAAGPSTTGFTARIRAGGAPGNVIVNWVAIGELA